MKNISTIIVALIGLCFMTGSTRAQSIAKIDMIKTLDEIPAPPASTVEAHARATCTDSRCKVDELFNAYERDIQSARKQWETLNAVQSRQVDSNKRLASALGAAQGKSKKDQIEIAGKNLPGVNKKALTLAEVMQDPESMKKIAAMSQDEKLAYIQSILNPHSNPVVGQDAGMATTKQGFQQRMIHDPAFAAAWKKKTPAEQDAYFKEQASKNGTDWKSMASQSRKRAAASAPKETVTSSGGTGNSNDLLGFDDDSKAATGSPASQLKQQSDAAMQGLLVFKVSTDQASARIVEILDATPAKQDSARVMHDRELKTKAKRIGVAVIHDEPGYHAIRLKSVTDEINAVNIALGNVANAFKRDKEQLDHICAGYNTSLMQSRYGETLTTPEDQMLVTNLAQTQVRAMSYIDQMEVALKEIYPRVAFLEIQKAVIEKETFGNYEELMVKGEGDD
ncbi:MAG: hypothetical protein Q8922_05125 [Bacteroidota bacterium]|nr:hypothetical protein [Bacteroidota bacterium]MDP4231916.1 hypothetical protein [Bacteroidota bacterium]MDP4241377.1 hypothetical protein [Bacteroidota bacterium]MDP4287300.1 hypothetical protein [Bacteroidota bacterium]